MLFKDYHLPQIRSGSKTVTRREWSENYARPNVGSVQIASDEMFTPDEEADCYIRILDVYDQPLGEMDDADARAEGDYEQLAEFREGYEAVYGDGAWDPEKVVTVVEFEYVGRERPADGEQQTLATDGGYPHSEKDLSGGVDGSARTPCCFEEVDSETTHSDSGRPSGAIWRCPGCGEEWEHPTETVIDGPWGENA